MVEPAKEGTNEAANEQTLGIPVASSIPGYACTDFKGIMFELPLKYETIKLIGKGTYGSVISAKNTLTGEQVSIKKLSHIEDLVSTHSSHSRS
jgi:serine/threonine protein kinase